MRLHQLALGSAVRARYAARRYGRGADRDLAGEVVTPTGRGRTSLGVEIEAGRGAHGFSWWAFVVTSNTVSVERGAIRWVVVACVCSYVGDGVACEPPGPALDPDVVVVYDPYTLVLTELVASGEPDADGSRDAAVLVGKYCGVPCSTSAPPTVTATGPDGTVYEGSLQRAELDVEVGSKLVDYYIWRAWLPPLSEGEFYTVSYADLTMTEASLEAALDGAQVSSVTAPANDVTSQVYCCLPGVGSCETEGPCIGERQYERQALKVQLPEHPGVVYRWKQRSADWGYAESLDGAVQIVRETAESDSSGEYCAELEALTVHSNVIESALLCAPANPDAGTLRPVSHEEIRSWWCPEGGVFDPAVTSDAPADFADLVQCESCLGPESCPIPAERCEALRELYPPWETTELVSEPPQEPAAPEAEGADDTAVVEEPASDGNAAPSDGDAAPAAEGEPADGLDGAPEVSTEPGNDPADEEPSESSEEAADVAPADAEAEPEEVALGEEASDGVGSDGELDATSAEMTAGTSAEPDIDEQDGAELGSAGEVHGVDTASDSGCRLSGNRAASPWSSAVWLSALAFVLWRRRR